MTSRDGHRLDKFLVDPMILVDLVTVDMDEDGDEKQEVLDRVSNTVDNLPEEWRAVIEMQVWGQHSVQEIADELGLHRNTVRRRLKRGKAALREQLSDLY